MAGCVVAAAMSGVSSHKRMLDQGRWRVRVLHADCVRLARCNWWMAPPARTRWCGRAP